MMPLAADAELLYPLSLFRQVEHEPLPPFQVLEGEEVPQPYHDLLVHHGDMTSRLEAFHRGEIHLEVLRRKVTPETYRREVVLRAGASALPVEYGAIEIFLQAFPEGLRERIVQGRQPLGGLLNASGFEYHSEPKAFIRLCSDRVMQQIFEAPLARDFFGRCNELVRADGEPLARIVEVLRP